ncbi:membrane-bound lytic murein transglycosylase D [Algoriphagus faecimaris]|uniref:Membrane-bound lytic murein transglycosylase D n=2 Tax=Algoriphagus faecimaris TaxID=686796 RepID=A0A1G6SB69_9BACT|nr:LysM peptidoglycan-binding domain-containing protein [Algoriphagus faecimaris]SDD13894.1 membrane-bound lytic murein transglycosylase D [Algoriphagus faecimaris]
MSPRITMRKKKILKLTFSLLFILPLLTQAQTPQVPAELEFADMIIRINPQARREIQLDVDALYRNPSYFKVKLDRVNLFMPYVERELKAVGVPLDLKYLVIQESGLIADAVSTSNAVGFWQFKQGTAEEVFLRVDNQIDERKNIVTSSRGAGLYLKKHNNSFDNWVCALVSYQMGLGGAKSYFGNRYNGQKVMDIDRNSHWYFKKFLAHKIAFENQLAILTSSRQRLVEVKVQGPTNLSTLAKRYQVSEDHLKEMNKWTSNGRIPAGNFSLFYIEEVSPDYQPAVIKSQPEPKPSPEKATTTLAAGPMDAFPKIEGNTQRATQPNQITINNLDGVQAAKTTSVEQFADQVGIKERKLRRLNDLDSDESIEAGKYYYTQKKKPKAAVETHVVQAGETLWSISQKYGIKLSSLKAKNRIRKDRDLKAGMVLNLQDHRKRGEDIPIVKINQTQRVAQAKPEASSPTPAKEVSTPKSATPSAQSSQLSHTVSPGETLYAISKKYGVTVDQIKNWNQIGSQNIISVGQKLTIFKP